MRVLHYAAMACALVVTSCYIFPFVLMAFPAANSKMILAAIGIALFGYSVFKNYGRNGLDKSFLQLTLWAFVISMIAWLATAVNNTHDYTFATYFISMWVWIGGAYTAVSCIKAVHGEISVRLVANYLLAVCVAQCVLAIIFDSYIAAFEWRVRTFTGEGYMGGGDEERLSGIGCALDVAGLRFSAILIMGAAMVVRAAARGETKVCAAYLLCMMIVVVIGSMISRTTAVGAVLAFLYLACGGAVAMRLRHGMELMSTFGALLVMTIVISTMLYHTNDNFRTNMRFGFEGFFSLAEKGEWQTHSNDILENMVVWPDNAKAWIIGDGYIENPLDGRLGSYDPYYVGPTYHGYYRQTDIGYCRFIFYFGVVGLAVFCLFFIKVTLILARRFPQYKWMFILILAMNFIGWCKVSSDLFMVFAPFLCISAGEEEEAEEVPEAVLA